jgi:dephospho-CoA kinase
MVLGLCGDYCAGKSMISGMLEELGFEAINADVLGHRARKSVEPEIRALFGTADRVRLGSLVFSDPEKLTKLEALVHPKLLELAEFELSRRSGRDIVLEAAILFKLGLEKYCDYILWVKAPFFVRFFRGLLRDRLPPGRILAKMLTQIYNRTQPSFLNSDILYIRNWGSRAHVLGKVLVLAEKIRNSPDKASSSHPEDT